MRIFRCLRSHNLKPEKEASMTHSFFLISSEGRHSYRITLPCFSDQAAFRDAAVMNRFYETAAGCLYREALRSLAGEERLIHFGCTPRVEEEEGKIRVTLLLSLQKSGTSTRRRTVTHLWQNGVLLREKKPRPHSFFRRRRKKGAETYIL